MNGYVTAGYLVTFVSIALYSVRMVWRGRALSKTLGRNR